MGKKSRNEDKKYVIAIKDYDKTKDGLESGTIRMEYESERYMDFFKQEFMKVKEMKGLRKFIKKTGQKKAEVQHFWSGLIDDEYTLIQIIFSKGDTEFRRLCDGKYIKYLSGLI